MKDKLINWGFLAIILLIVMGGIIKPIFKSNEINQNENRVAYEIPKFTLNDFFEKKYQDDFEKALSDQIPLASKMKIAIKTTKILSQKGFYNIFVNDSYTKLSNDIYQFNDNLVYFLYNLDAIKPYISAKVENINKASDLLPNVNIYLYYIEKDTDINFENNKKLGAYEYMKPLLNSKIKSNKFEINNFEEFNNNFYQTDHHWNYKGSYKAYQDLVHLMTNNEPLNYEKEVCLDSYMSGSKATTIGGSLIYKEQFCAYKFNFDNFSVKLNGKKADSYGNYERYFENSTEPISYGDFYGWDDGLIELDFNNKDKENLLIIGESYDNAINLLIASHFNKTYNVDLRNYEESMGEKFNIKNFVEEQHITNILLIGNVDYYTMSTFNIVR